MARIVKELPKSKRGRPVKYPYGQWFNTKKWALLEGEDFTVAPGSMLAALYAAQNRLGITITTRKVTDPETGLTTITVQRLVGAVAQREQAKRARS